MSYFEKAWVLVSRWWVGELFAVSCLLLACGRFVIHVRGIMDVSLGDETCYLQGGVLLLKYGPPSASYAPLYSFWYYLLSLLCPDRTNLYYLNTQILVAGIPILAYLVMRRMQVHRIAALMLSFLVLISDANLLVNPKPGHFALVLILVSILCSSFFRSAYVKLVVAAAGVWVASYVRPELWIAFVLLVICSVTALFAEFRRLTLSARLIPPLMLGTLSILMALAMGVPWTSDGDRSITAFGQHFAFNWVNWTKSELNPWADWRSIMGRCFGQDDSVSGALVENPGLVMRHIGANAVRSLSRMSDLWFGHVSLLRPCSQNAARLEKWALASVVLAAVLVRRRWFVSKVRCGLARARVLAAIVCCCVVPILGVWFVIYPRDHYMLLPGVLLILLLSVALFASDGRWGHPALLPALAVLMVLFTPVPPKGLRESCQVRQTIKSLQALGITQEAVILEAEGGYGVYVGDNFRRIPEYQKKMPFNEFAESEHIDIIIVSEYLELDHRFKNDPEWKEFLANPGEHGFVRRSIAGSKREIMVREALMQERE